MSNTNSEEAFNIRTGFVKPETLEIAKNELRETPEIKEAAIKEVIVETYFGLTFEKKNSMTIFKNRSLDRKRYLFYFFNFSCVSC